MYVRVVCSMPVANMLSGIEIAFRFAGIWQKLTILCAITCFIAGRSGLKAIPSVFMYFMFR